ncbi:MAG: sulfatase, partial [Phycisphaerales bacterium]
MSARTSCAVKSLAAMAIAGAACLLLCPIGCKRPPPEPPANDYNVVFISFDTLRADRLNCYGYQDRRVSPNIDALAAEGILFENHITSSPWTTPAHLSMLTSLYPSAHGVLRSFSEIKDDLTTGATVQGLPSVRTTLAEVLKDRGFQTAAFTGGGTMDPKIGFAQGFEHYDISMFKLNTMNTEAMFRWIREHADERFFLFWHCFEVHGPYVNTDFLKEVLPAEKATRVSEELKKLARPLRWHTPTMEEHQAKHLDFRRLLNREEAYTREVCEALYAGGVRSADRWLGALIARLRRLGLYDRTLIIFTSDHGEEFAERREDYFYNRHGHTLYEEMVKVPLIIKLPDQAHAGSRIATQVRIIDLMPTVLDVLGIRLRKSEMQGLSLRPLWEEPAKQEDRLAVSEALSQLDEKKSVRTDRYKYIVTSDEYTVRRHGRKYLPEEPHEKELYDLRRDPSERVNLLESSQG